ncbi:MAG: dihydrofolate synthase/folylpolyglutamate synthase [Ktedonobacterales bacterium]|jgi:dihydrofolate synthase/folylpolyglutamate synthase|nr:MAG: dihydrofolate synthase/folylpolyglutamate synthase [Ktedonobacterales bacterium]
MTFDSYAEALAWLYSFSDTERTGNFTRDREDNLARERALLAALGNPQRAYGVTHIAGTKGKGSTSALLAAILQAAGLRTGLYTQPDLHTFRERMRVNGQLISGDEVARLAERVRAAVDAAGTPLGAYITYEVATALAFLYFREADAEHAVIEVGLGGRLDATNVVEPLLTIITSISYDHMSVLGNTLGEIATEKAGILKRGVPLVTSARAPEALAAITRIAVEREVPLFRVGPAGEADCAYTYRAGAYSSERQYADVVTPTGVYRDLEIALLGEHQIENAATAVAAAEQLRAAGLPISEDAIRAGLRSAHWPARLQVVGRAPWTIVDGAHNADSFARLLAALRRHFTYERLVLVLGLMADKDAAGIADEIARAGVDCVVATAAANPRAATPESIIATLREHAPAVAARAARDTSAALQAALAEAGPRDLVCVAGSLYLAGEALRWFATHATAPEAAAIEIAGVDH